MLSDLIPAHLHLVLRPAPRRLQRCRRSRARQLAWLRDPDGNWLSMAQFPR
jgi:hypothetical protein